VVAEPTGSAGLDVELTGAAEAAAVLVATSEPDQVLAVGRRRPLEDLVHSTRGTVLVLDRSAQDQPSIVSQAAVLHGEGVRVRTLSLFYEEWLGKLPITELERVSMMFDIGEVHRQRYTRLKRVVDVVLGALGTIGLALLVPIVLVANRFGNRGPLLYRQTRVGKGGHEFEILKFRTMRPATSTVSTEWTDTDDPRITRFGHVLRRSHLDELPQVVNILRGELSIVGPRPEQPRYVADLSEKLPFYGMRHLVRPGLTGWAQVKYGYAGDERDALEKLQYEFFYLRRQSLSLDLRIVVRTVRSVVGGDGR
jgi:lipopolysaccharide/colanic/teichoic acid biosynthesis glycosyltransferase